MKKHLLWALCPKCKCYVIPKISVRLTNEPRTSKLEDLNFERFMIYQPEYLKLNYNNILLKEFGLKLDLEAFRNKYNSLFWSSIWYFSVINLPFDLFLPYKKKDISPFKRFISFGRSLTLESFENLEIDQSICLHYRKSKYTADESKLVIDESSIDQSCINANFIDLTSNKSKHSMNTINYREYVNDLQEAVKSRTKSFDLPPRDNVI
jgi:hypothetical protein